MVDNKIIMQEQISKIKNKLIIVEGYKDKVALTKLGCKKILTLESKPLFTIPDHIPKNTKEIILLTDLDKKGKQLYHKLKLILTKHKIKINDTFRIYLFKETKIRQIEGLKKSNLL